VFEDPAVSGADVVVAGLVKVCDELVEQALDGLERRAA
jgi:hypothetical protein